jgi:hypothetical protein
MACPPIRCCDTPEMAAGSFYARVGNIRARGIDRDLAPAGRYHQVHVFHGHGAQQHLIAQHQRADIAEPLPEADADRSHVREVMLRPSAIDTSRIDSVSSLSCKATCSGIHSMSAPVSASAVTLTGSRSGPLRLLSSMSAKTCPILMNPRGALTLPGNHRNRTGA